jgi:hypothetical protein
VSRRTVLATAPAGASSCHVSQCAPAHARRQIALGSRATSASVAAGIRVVERTGVRTIICPRDATARSYTVMLPAGLATTHRHHHRLDAPRAAPGS